MANPWRNLPQELTFLLLLELGAFTLGDKSPKGEKGHQGERKTPKNLVFPGK
jgi:hypothetical protein